MSEEYSIADNKQTDFGFRVDAQAEDPLRPDSPCPVRSLRMTLSWVESPVLATGTELFFQVIIICRTAVPKLFLAPGKTLFPWTGVGVAGEGDGSRGNGGGAVAEETLLTCHSLYSPVPTKPRPSTIPCISSNLRPGGWGPLL